MREAHSLLVSTLAYHHWFVILDLFPAGRLQSVNWITFTMDTALHCSIPTVQSHEIHPYYAPQ